MLTDEQIKKNKEEYISLLRTIKREGAKIDELIQRLEKSDFFEAPASTKYHNSFKGGLADHCLNVFYNLMHLATYKYGTVKDDMKESITILGLLHDISKINYYVPTVKNIKKYSDEGTKIDNLGKFDWVSVPGYAVADKTFVYGNHEMTSEFLVRQFIPLTTEESIAILHHMGSMSADCAKDNISEVYSTYPLSCLLYCADMISTYCDEKNY